MILGRIAEQNRFRSPELERVVVEAIVAELLELPYGTPSTVRAGVAHGLVFLGSTQKLSEASYEVINHALHQAADDETASILLLALAKAEQPAAFERAAEMYRRQPIGTTAWRHLLNYFDLVRDERAVALLVDPTVKEGAAGGGDKDAVIRLAHVIQRLAHAPFQISDDSAEQTRAALSRWWKDHETNRRYHLDGPP